MRADPARVSASARLVRIAFASLVLAGCAAQVGPRPIARGTPCAACGMGIADLRFACERDNGDGWRVYDSIECLLRERGSSSRTWLTDYDAASLHAADSMWVVRGEFASPMGGGYAAFLDRSAASDIASKTRGRVARLAEFPGDEARAVAENQDSTRSRP